MKTQHSQKEINSSFFKGRRAPLKKKKKKKFGKKKNHVTMWELILEVLGQERSGAVSDMVPSRSKI